MEKSRNVEQEILCAARLVFHQKGYKESTMRDIAAHANVNMAMLHYYYRSKENLFFILFDEAFQTLYERIVKIISDEEPDIFEKIRQIVSQYVGFYRDNPNIPQFIVGEFIRNPEIIGKRMQQLTKPIDTYEAFVSQLESAINEGTIRPISPLSLVINILSLCIFPALVRPVLDEIPGMNKSLLTEISASREKEVADFIIHSIQT